MYGQQPKKITDRVTILEKCREYMQNPGKFFYAIYDRNKNMIIEGPGILSIHTGESAITITLTNSDSNYTGATYILDYFDIEYIQEVEV